MSHRLQPCQACRRFVREPASTCPFCGAARASGVPVGLAAAALGASLVLAGCPQALAPAYGGPPPQERPQPAPTSAPATAPATAPVARPIPLEAAPAYGAAPIPPSPRRGRGR